MSNMCGGLRCESPTVSGSLFCELHQPKRGEQEPSVEDNQIDGLMRHLDAARKRIEELESSATVFANKDQTIFNLSARVRELEAEKNGLVSQNAALRRDLDNRHEHIKSQGLVNDANLKRLDDSVAHIEDLNAQVNALKAENKNQLRCIIAQGKVFGTLVVQ